MPRYSHYLDEHDYEPTAVDPALCTAVLVDPDEPTREPLRLRLSDLTYQSTDPADPRPPSLRRCTRLVALEIADDPGEHPEASGVSSIEGYYLHDVHIRTSWDERTFPLTSVDFRRIDEISDVILY